MTVVVHHGPSASSLVTARGEYPIPLIPSGRGLGIVEQLERAAARRAVRAFPILEPAPAVAVKAPARKPVRSRATSRPLLTPRPTRSPRAALFPDDAALELRREYESGATIRAIATRHGCSRDTIAKAIRRVGGEIRNVAPPRSTSPTPQQVQVFVAQYAQGATLKALAREHGFHAKTIRDYIRASDVAEREPVDLSPQEQAKRRAGVVADYLDGHSINAIAGKYGVTRRTVRRNIIAAGHAVEGEQAEGMWS